jgi:hypothetical protein
MGVEVAQAELEYLTALVAEEAIQLALLMVAVVKVA